MPSLPQYPGKYPFATVVGQRQFLARRRKRHGLKQIRVPEGIILSFADPFNKEEAEKHGAKMVPGMGHVYSLRDTRNKIGIVFAHGYGAPIAAQLMENLIEAGARRFVVIGSAGSLQRKLSPGTFVVTSKALRDEGTSFHFQPASRFARPSRSMQGHLEDALKSSRRSYYVAPTWSTDAPSRETFAEVQHYRRIGIGTVDMEASALFAVAKARNIRIASLFRVSDLVREKWRGPKGKFVPIKARDAMISIAKKALTRALERETTHKPTFETRRPVEPLKPLKPANLFVIKGAGWARKGSLPVKLREPRKEASRVSLRGARQLSVPGEKKWYIGSKLMPAKRLKR
ncbi:nucleoside phosphorylase [archaeon]|nr:nucleoside phosphorylase [archaeon]